MKDDKRDSGEEFVDDEYVTNIAYIEGRKLAKHARSSSLPLDTIVAGFMDNIKCFTHDVLDISTKDGDITIREDELGSVTKSDLKKMGISRRQLHLCFELGVDLMDVEGVSPRDRIRPVAHQTLDGKWMVDLVRYSPLTDPLMNGASSERA